MCNSNEWRFISGGKKISQSKSIVIISISSGIISELIINIGVNGKFENWGI
jgi:hypothetical protein